MAKILSHVWSVIRGSVGGITYLAGPTGQIIARQRTAPVQPISLWKTAAKNALNSGNAEWEKLTAAEQQAWENYALTCTFLGATGSYTVPGRQLMIGAMQLMYYITQIGLASPTIVKTAPALTGFLLPTNIQIVDPSGPATTGIGVSITADPDDDTTCLINMSGLLSKERHFWKGPWDSTQTAAVIIPAGTTVKVDFTGMTLGDVHFFRVKCVSDDVGPRLSAPHYLRGEAVTVI